MAHEEAPDRNRENDIEAITRKMKELEQELHSSLAGFMGGLGTMLIVIAVTTAPLSPIVLGIGSFLTLASILLAAWIEWALR